MIFKSAELALEKRQDTRLLVELEKLRASSARQFPPVAPACVRIAIVIRRRINRPACSGFGVLCSRWAAQFLVFRRLGPALADTRFSRMREHGRCVLLDGRSATGAFFYAIR
jgi:hypothetical protein